MDIPVMWPSCFTEEEVAAFTLGDCWHLSGILDEFGYEQVFVGTRADLDNTWAHAMNRLPNGKYFDVTGVYSFAEVDSIWGEEVRRWEGVEHEVVIAPAGDLGVALYGQRRQYPHVDGDIVALRLLEVVSAFS